MTPDEVRLSSYKKATETLIMALEAVRDTTEEELIREYCNGILRITSEYLADNNALADNSERVLNVIDNLRINHESA